MKEPYDGRNEGLSPTELDCKKIAWMVQHSPEWDFENVELEDYLQTVPDYPSDEEVEGFNHLSLGPLPDFKKKVVTHE